MPDIRNTRVIDIFNELKSYGVDVSCYDPEANAAEVKHDYGIDLSSSAETHAPSVAVILAVKHRALLATYSWEKIVALGGGRAQVVIDVKGFLEKRPGNSDAAVWQL